MKSFIMLAVTLVACDLKAAEPLVWPQFRGPDNSGVAEGQHPPVEFGPDKNVKWKVAVPSGLSSPVVAGDVLVMTAFDGGKLYTIAYHRESGKEAWRAEAPAKQVEPYHAIEGSPAASTPATDGQRIVSYFGSCGLFCYDLSGKELWRSEMPAAATAGNFGSGVSPILVDGLVVLVRDDTKDSKILAVDASDGSTRWETKRRSIISYSTPVVWDTPQGKQVVVAGHARMNAYDLKTGAEKWSAAGVPSGCCASPMTADGILFFAGWSPGAGSDEEQAQMPTFDGMLKDLDADKDGVLSREEAEKTFAGFFDNQDLNKDGRITREEWTMLMKFMSEGESSAFAMKPGEAGKTEPQVLWKQTRGLPYVSSAIVYGGQLVMVKDGGIVTAYDAKTGKQAYQKRAAAGGKYYASPVAAGDHIYFTSLDGEITVLKAGSEQPEVAAQNASLEERIAATPAIADNTLYVRTAGHLYAFAASEK